MAKKFWVARDAKGRIVTWADSQIICLKRAMEWAEQRVRVTKRPITEFATTAELYTMPKPKFRVGQKIRRIGLTTVKKVLAVGDRPDLVGCVSTHTIFGNHPREGGLVFESETNFEAAS